MKVLIVYPRCSVLLLRKLCFGYPISLSVSLIGQRTTNVQIRKHIISLMLFFNILELFNIVECTINSYILQ